MKKLFPFMLLFVTSLAFTACGSDDDDDPSPSVPEDKNIVNGHEFVDLGLSVKWATCNVGAEYPGDYGDYFAWGDTTPYYANGHSQDTPCTNWITGKTGYNLESYFDAKDDKGYEYETYALNKETKLKPKHDAATANWGAPWRMPTKEELQELVDNCSWTWSSQGYYKVTSKKNGNFIYFPAAGIRILHSLHYAGSYGGYWSSYLDTSDSRCAVSLDMKSDYVSTFHPERYDGRSVRAVYP